MINSKITGTGGYLPEKVVTNADLEKIVDTTDEWIFSRTGIKKRHLVVDGETTCDLAEKAALNAMEAAGITKDDIDLIIVATATPDRFAPSTAAIVQDKIKAYNSVAFDISAVCSGFLYGSVINVHKFL